MFKKNPDSHVVLVCLMAVFALVTAFSQQAHSWNGNHPDDMTNEGWSYPEVQDSDDYFLPFLIVDNMTNEGWVEPLIDESTHDALPAQHIDSVTNEGLSTAHRQERVDYMLAFTDYTDLPSFETAAGGNLATIAFTEVPVGTVVTDHYLGVHAEFTDGNDVTQENASSFPTDDIGVNGDGRVHIRLTEPAIAIGSDYPGALTIELWDHQGGTLLYTSSAFGGSGAGMFGGVVATTPFSFVVLRDWVDDRVYLDNIYIIQGTFYEYVPMIIKSSAGP